MTYLPGDDAPVPFSAVRADGGGRAVILVSGEVDIATAADLEDVLTAAVDEGSEEIVVDLSGVTFLDSMAMGVLVTAFIRQARRRHRLVLASPSQRVRRTLELAGLLKVFNLEGTES